MDLFAPRDDAAARRALQVVLVIAAAVLSVYTVLVPPPGALLLPVAAVVVALVSSAAVLKVAGRAPRWAFGGLPLLGVVAVAGLDVVTGDASTAAQVFFLLPVLFAATHLRPAGAWVVTGAAVVGETVTTLTLLPLQEGLTDAAYVSAVAVATTMLLVRANARTDRLVDELRQQAAVDPLTGLVTRRVLDDAAACALTSADTAGGTSLLVVDVDHFKSVNDSHGHPVGDAVLVRAGALLTELGGADAVVSRLGGDELAALLPGAGLEDALRVAESVVAGVRAITVPVRDEGGPQVAVTVSVGVAHAPGHATDLEGLYRAADAALYRAKRSGRDRAAVAGADDVAPPGAVPAPLVVPPVQRVRGEVEARSR